LLLSLVAMNITLWDFDEQIFIIYPLDELREEGKRLEQLGAQKPDTIWDYMIYSI
jgi:hypothetical protein